MKIPVDEYLFFNKFIFSGGKPKRSARPGTAPACVYLCIRPLHHALCHLSGIPSLLEGKISHVNFYYMKYIRTKTFQELSGSMLAVCIIYQVISMQAIGYLLDKRFSFIILLSYYSFID